VLAKEEQWKESLEKLDKAKELDPASDEDEGVKALRTLGQEKLGGGK
jgi:hypothetical protein